MFDKNNTLDGICKEATFQMQKFASIKTWEYVNL